MVWWPPHPITVQLTCIHYKIHATQLHPPLTPMDHHNSTPQLCTYMNSNAKINSKQLTSGSASCTENVDGTWTPPISVTAESCSPWTSTSFSVLIPSIICCKIINRRKSCRLIHLNTYVTREMSCTTSTDTHRSTQQTDKQMVHWDFQNNSFHVKEHWNIQGVPGGMCNTSEECSLC